MVLFVVGMTHTACVALFCTLFKTWVSHSSTMLCYVACHLLACMSSPQAYQKSPFLLPLCVLGVILPSAYRHPHSRVLLPRSRHGRRGWCRTHRRPRALSQCPQWREKARARVRVRVRVRRSLTSAPSAWQKKWRCSTGWLSRQPEWPAPEGTHANAGPTLATRLNLSHWEIWSRYGRSRIMCSLSSRITVFSNHIFFFPFFFFKKTQVQKSSKSDLS